MVCPTPSSNWVICNNLIQGSYPGHPELNVHMKILDSILDCGVTTFVSLLEAHEQSMFRPYKAYVKSLAPQTEFVELPIPDMGVTDDKIISEVADTIADGINNRNKVYYIHCWGGHGRSGTLVALVLNKLGLPCKEALFCVKQCHQTREYNGDIPSPQTSEQLSQVYRLSI